MIKWWRAWWQQRQALAAWAELEPPPADAPPAQAIEPPVVRPSLPAPFSQAWMHNLSPEDLSVLTNQVMWARDTITWMMNQVGMHRWDQHDCPVYCQPPTIDYLLAQCNIADLRLLVSVFAKDSVHMGVPADDFEGIIDDE